MFSILSEGRGAGALQRGFLRLLLVGFPGPGILLVPQPREGQHCLWASTGLWAAATERPADGTPHLPTSQWGHWQAGRSHRQRALGSRATSTERSPPNKTVMVPGPGTGPCPGPSRSWPLIPSPCPQSLTQAASLSVRRRLQLCQCPLALRPAPTATVPGGWNVRP